MSLTLQPEKQRIYVLGNTFPIKDQLKSLQAHWDADRKAWWVGKKKEAQLKELLESVGQKCRSTSRPRGLQTSVIGRAKYKGKTYYVVWAGTTRAGKDSMKLCFRDGSKEFWVDAAPSGSGQDDRAVFIKRYQEPKTIQELQAFAKQMKDPDRGPTRSELYEHLELLDDMDCFQEAQQFARQHGLRY